MKKDLRQRKAFYRLKKLEAKEAYKKRTGLKIALGFKESQEFKKVLRNERRSLNRLKKREIEEKVIFDTKPKGGIGRPKKDPIQIRETVESSQKFFWEVLTMNMGDSNNALDLWNEAEQQGGKIPGFTLFGIVVDYDGNRKTYSTYFYFARALSQLARDAAKLQTYEYVKDEESGKNRKKTTYYPMVNLELAEEAIDGDEDNNIVYIIVEGVN